MPKSILGRQLDELSGLDTEGEGTDPRKIAGRGTDPLDPIIGGGLPSQRSVGPGGKAAKFGQRFVWEGDVEQDFQKFFQENVGAALEPFKRQRRLESDSPDSGVFGRQRTGVETEDFYALTTGQAREVERSLREQFTEQRTRQIAETGRQRARSRAAQPGIAARRRAEQQQLVTGGGGGTGGGTLLTSPFGLLESPRLRQQTLLGGAR